MLIGNFSGMSRWLLPWLACLIALATLLGQDATDVDAFRQLYGELRNQIESDIDGATQFLEDKIAEAPDSIDRQVLRQTLALAFLEREKNNEAATQLRKLLDFQIRGIAVPENQSGLWMTLQDYRNCASQQAFAEAVEQGFAALRRIAETHPIDTTFPLAQVAIMQAQVLVDQNEPEAARTLVTQQVQRLVEACQAEQAGEETMLTLLGTLRTLTGESPENDLWRKQCVESLDTYSLLALEKFPDSAAIQNSYAETQLNMITRWGQDDPEATEQRIERVSKKISPLALRNRSLQAILRRIRVHQERMAAAKPAESLVGKPMPAWEIDAWVNASDLKQDDFRGKVVLIDFWAMWCGPCIATFPHLRQWRDEFAEQGFEIVGVTQYYDFVWDDLNERATQSQGPVDATEERETLVKFLEHHRLKHPVFVAPKQSEMGGEYGVRGIPHVVLVDRAGTVRLIKTGAGQQTANEIHEKIKELISEPAQAES